MAAVEGEELCGFIIRITVRSPKERREVDVNEANSVRQLKEQIAADFSATYDQLCVIFAGKMLSDADRLNECGVKEGMTLHLVIKSAQRESASDHMPQIHQTAPMHVDIGATPFGLGDMGGLAGLSNLGMGSANFMDLQQSLQKEVFRNPTLLRTVMDNPLVQHITSSPGMMHQLINSNPQMRELMERNPEISEMLNNTELMSQTLEMARHPAMLQEMMRSHDRNANPERAATLHDVNIGAAAAAQADANSGSAGGESEAAAGRLAGKAAAARSLATAGLQGSVFRDSSITSMMQQMMQNPQLMTNILQSPYMQSMMQYMATNPALMQQMISLNPMFGNSPVLQEQMRQSLPYINQQFGNTDVQSLMTNPRALQAMLQIQEGLAQLETEAPNLVTRLGITPPAEILSPPPPTDSEQAAPPAQPPVNPYAQFMTHMLSAVSGGDQNLPEDVRYRSQMTQLLAMGFANVDSNLQALVASSGNVNVAIDTLMKQRSG